MSNCIKCNGTMIGDGYNSVLHCEYATEDSYEFHEADASPVYCDYKSLEEHLSDLREVTSWHRNFITVNDDSTVIAWDESQANIINGDCSTVAKAMVILDEYGKTLEPDALDGARMLEAERGYTDSYGLTSETSSLPDSYDEDK